METVLKDTRVAESQIDDFVFWTYADLEARRIVRGRSDLHRKQHNLGFPRPIRLTQGRRPGALFRATDVIAWVERMTAEAAE